MEDDKRTYLGQHFLIDFRTISKIVDSCSISKSDVVLELGTGFGYLTKEISSFAKSVYSYEIDKELYSKAKTYLANNTNVQLFNQDFFVQGDFKFDYFLSNIPYSRSKDVVKWMASHEFREAVVMVQKEFSEKILASPGSANYSVVSVISQYCFEIDSLFDVEKSSFSPPPKIESRVIRMKRKKNKITKDMMIWLEYLFSNRNKKSEPLLNIKDYGNKKIDQLDAETLLKITNDLQYRKKIP
ncbi:16S rRNA (adenine(1518)-N(6)/adenine(1519)-N(6))-dimethyltransferaseRsmA [soil metagenome]